ncbi:MAG: glutamate synthase subunit beta [Planctomycetaceae bacterium]|nr:glutamate synthase subunit beta [Planctomycetaceae bacterium]
MGKPTGFTDYPRQDVPHRPVGQRVKDFFEIDLPLDEEALRTQAARCMDCGIPFCHGAGCPLGNRIPEFNDMVYLNRWADALEILHSTNNFPEITGRICPAPCEASCTLNINGDAVLIKHIELQIAERGWQQGWIKPMPAPVKSGKRVAVIGSGPAGLAAAQQLARMGHDVVVFEKDARPGGLLRYGIPDFKLDKRILDRRIDQMKAEGVEFQCNAVIGEDLSGKYLRSRFQAIVLTMGAGRPRELDVPGRGLENVHFAMEYLAQQNRINSGEIVDGDVISAKDRVVVVIGGGDTGSDCVGTARRQGAREIHQYEILPQPPRRRPSDTPWPTWPRILRTSSSHEEGCTRRWCVLTKRLSGIGETVRELHGIEVAWTHKGGRWDMKEVPGTNFTQAADLVLIAMGFVHVEHSGLVEDLGCQLDERGNVKITNCATSVPGVYAAGDAQSGASLVVRAIASGRETAAAVNQFLSQ